MLCKIVTCSGQFLSTSSTWPLSWIVMKSPWESQVQILCTTVLSQPGVAWRRDQTFGRQVLQWECTQWASTPSCSPTATCRTASHSCPTDPPVIKCIRGLISRCFFKRHTSQWRGHLFSLRLCLDSSNKYLPSTCIGWEGLCIVANSSCSFQPKKKFIYFIDFRTQLVEVFRVMIILEPAHRESWCEQEGVRGCRGSASPPRWRPSPWTASGPWTFRLLWPLLNSYLR